MNELSIFTGIGGSILTGEELGWNNVGCVEFDQKACAILNRNFPNLKIWNCDIGIFNKLFAHGYKGVDLITAGFPCQPFSSSGKRLGEADSRNGWPATRRCIGVVRPPIAFLESVPGLTSFRYTQRIFGDLAEMGYDARWCIVSAAEVGAPHIRERLWILANNSSPQTERRNEGGFFRLSTGGGEEMADSEGERFEDIEGRSTSARPQGIGRSGSDHWQDCELIECGDGKFRPVKPGVRLLAHGIPGKVRVPILKGLGNAWCPQAAAKAWEILTS
jgi:DNA (cytosine-5)-methyltransferase 1